MRWVAILRGWCGAGGRLDGPAHERGMSQARAAKCVRSDAGQGAGTRPRRVRQIERKAPTRDPAGRRTHSLAESWGFEPQIVFWTILA